MATNFNLLFRPVELGLAPVRMLGESARRLASSSHLAERLQEEAVQDSRSREVETAIMLGLELKGRLQSTPDLKIEIREKFEQDINSLAQRIGHTVIDAAGGIDVINSPSSSRFTHTEI